MRKIAFPLLFILSCSSLAGATPAETSKKFQQKDMRLTLKRADENHDGRVSREEFTKKKNEKFSRYDRNNDEVLDPQEQEVVITESNAKMQCRLEE